MNNTKNIFCKVHTQKYGERITHIDEIKFQSFEGRELYELADEYAREVADQYEKEARRVSRMLWFSLGFGIAIGLCCWVIYFHN